MKPYIYSIMKPYIYLAGPYSHPDPEIQHKRGIDHCKVAALLLADGHLVYSPIAETMNLCQYGDIKGTSWETWREKDLMQLSKHDEIYIIILEGWSESKGTRGEIKFAMQHNLPIYFFYPGANIVYQMSYIEVLRELHVKKVGELND